MSTSPGRLYEFESFQLDTSECQLLHQGLAVPLTPKAFEMLVLLVERGGHLVEKGELMDKLWPDTAVEEANLTNNVWTLRKALGEGRNRHHYIETVPKRGYRFLPDVRELRGVHNGLVPEKPTLAHVQAQEQAQMDDDAGVPHAAAPSALPLDTKAKPSPRVKLFVAGLLFFVVLAVVAAIYRTWFVRDSKSIAEGASSRPALQSIAVLPFRMAGAGVDEEYLGVGMSDALIVKLGGVRRVIVRPISAVRRYVAAAQDPLAAGREQGVEAVLDGSVQRAGERIRVSVQLLRVADGATLWSKQFDERFTDIFAVQDSISERVTSDLLARMRGQEGVRLAKQEKIDIEAYQAYLKGRYFWNKRTLQGFRKAVDYFRQAIEIDPTYAQAYAGLGDALLYLGGDDPASQEESAKQAKAAVLRALELDETLADAHASLGLYAYDTDFAEAERQLRRAIELNPNHATAHQWYGEFLAYMGRFDEAISEIQRAHEIDPLSLIISTDVGKVYAIARQYDRAIEQFKKTLEMDTNFEQAITLLGLTYAFTGQTGKAIAELHKIKNLDDLPLAVAFLGYAYGVSGMKREAQGVRQHLEEMSKRTYITPYSMSFVDMGLGDKERVFEELEQMFKGQYEGRISLKINPLYDSIRSDPRFTELMQRAGFRPALTPPIEGPRAGVHHPSMNARHPL